MKGFIIATLSVLSLCVFGRQKPTMTPYIETDGVASYMDLGFVPTENLEFELDFNSVSIVGSAYNYIQGCGSALSTRYCIRFAPSTSLYSTASPTLTISDSELKRIVVKYRTGELEFDGSKYDCSYTTTSLTKNLFLGWLAGNDNYHSNTKYYGAKYWDVVDGKRTLIRDLVPYSGPRGVGLLDRVNDVLYANANTSGTLTYGVEGGGIPKAPYIRTSGTTNSFWYMPYSRVGYDNSVATPVTVKIDVKVDGVNDNVSNYILGAPYGWIASNFGFSSTHNKWSAQYLGNSLAASGYVQIEDYCDVYSRNTYEFGRGSDVGMKLNGVEVKPPLSDSVKFARYGFALGGNPQNKESIETVSDPSMITVYGYEFSTNGVLLGKFKPAQKDGVAGMTNELNGDFYPASNCIYGEESEAVMLGGVGKIEMPKTPWNDYVMNGLIAQFDGECNTDAGHNPDSETWDDLRSGYKMTKTQYGSWGDKYFLSSSISGAENYAAIGDLIDCKEGTFEIVFDSTSSGNVPVLSNCGNFSLFIVNSAVHLSDYVDKLIDIQNPLPTSSMSISGRPEDSSAYLIVDNCFVDGAVKQLQNIRSALSVSSSYRNNLYIGNVSSRGLSPYNGRIYSIRFYNRKLTAEEILHNHEIDKQRFGIQ